MKATLRVYACVLAAFCAVASTIHADTTVRYRATSSQLVLFKQPQNAPFASVSYTLFAKGSRVRSEMVDVTGRAWWFIADRSTGEAFGVDPVARVYWPESAAWGCDQIPLQVARATRRLLNASGTEQLNVEDAVPMNATEHAANMVAISFTGRVLGAPQPVQAVLQLYFARDERAVFGPQCERDFYCGNRPSKTAWRAALQNTLGIGPGQAEMLSGVIAAPVQATLHADLGIGSADVTLSAVEISAMSLSDDLFAIPKDFSRKP
jgi:hypothetical protein